ncbi:pilus assembly protein PilP [Cupriavidus sp. TMH.W2]|uniref:pilus assembly protein PilP n=1 Tax=Cupriavidus sp. TMH.W2 TaxID=3434465 RepID=UPI003D7779CA
MSRTIRTRSLAWTASPRALAAAALAVGLLGACGASDEDALRQWMNATRSARAKPPEPVPDARPYVPREYAAANAPEPFAQEKIGELNRTLADSPEAGRRREPLEDYPLENFKMLGMMKKNGETYGIVRVDNKIHHVKVGQYLGQSYGRVVRITDQEIVLRELVREGVSEWKEKMTSLKLEAAA